MKLGGFGKGPAGMKLGGFGNGPAGIRLGGLDGFYVNGLSDPAFND